MNDLLTFGKKPTKLANIIAFIVDVLIWSFVAFILSTGGLFFFRENEYIMAVLSIVIIVVFALRLWRRSVHVNSFFPVEISGRFAVFLRPVKRKAYDMALMQDLRFVRHFLFFRYNGWPYLMPVPISKQERIELVSSINSANQKLNKFDASDMLKSTD